MAVPATALTVRDLTFAYPDQQPLFSRWSATFPIGITLLYGDSASGKSTLLSLLTGTDAVDGQLAIGDCDLRRQPQAYRSQVFRPQMADESLDPITPIAYATSLSARLPRFDLAGWRVHALGFGLEPHLEKPLYQLSTGSRRKVGLAATLASGCRLLLLDEPTAALDMPSISHLKRALTELAAQSQHIVVLASYQRWPDVPLCAEIELPTP